MHLQDSNSHASCMSSEVYPFTTAPRWIRRRNDATTAAVIFREGLLHAIYCYSIT